MKIWKILLVGFCLFAGTITVSAAGEADTARQESNAEEDTAGEQKGPETAQTEKTEAGFIEEELMAEMDFTQVQSMLDEMLGGNRFSFSDAVKRLLSGEEAFSGEAVQELLRGLFFSRLEQERGMFARVLLLVLLAAVFANFAAVFENGQIGEISFYVVYLLLFMMVMEVFSGLSSSLSESIRWMAEFMKGLTPAYFMAVAASSGAVTAAAFYQGVLLLVWLLQWVLLTVILPGVNLYILLKLVNHLSREEMLSKMAELLHTAINWGLKSLLGMVAGLQVVRGLVSPVIDSLKRSTIGKTAGALPGGGNAINAVTELVVTGAVLVRNCLGVVILIALVLAGAGPMIHYAVMSVSYRFLSAVSQPVSDKRMVECLSTLGEGCALLLKILFTAEVLCMLTFIILLVSFGGGP